MNEKLYEFKKMILDSGLFKRKNNGWYQGKECPYCGDCKGHYHIHIILDDDSSIAQNCFKCNVHGTVDEKMLDCYGIEWKGYIPRGKRSRKITEGREDFKKIDILSYDDNVEYLLKCKRYIDGRLGVDISKEEMGMFGLVGNPGGYAKMFLDDTLTGYDGRCWFICTNGMLIGRDMLKKKDGWEKFCGNVNLRERMLYSIKAPFDLYKTINICICEGIMDAIGLYYHGMIDNGFFISVLGRDYMAGVKYALNKGIFGDSVCIRIYKDSDVKEVKIDKSLCSWFKSVNVYMNTIGKDYGVTADEIDIEMVM